MMSGDLRERDPSPRRRMAGEPGGGRVRPRSQPGRLVRIGPELVHPAPPHNLPAAFTSFIGRAAEIAAVANRLAHARLVTLTGAPGVGKTRLAVEVAHALLERYPDGVWVAELASISEPELVPQAVARALGIPEDATHPVTVSLTIALRQRRTLLILDNCEHLLASCAPLAETLLQACAQLTILATSREALGLPGETVWTLAPLALPEAAAEGSVAQAEQAEAVQLFCDRAAAAQPGFALTVDNLAAVLEVCRRLDGIPLALELAARRLKALTVQQLAMRLDARFQVLEAGTRSVVPHHQTLRALVDWSYDVLSPAERTLLARLAVFAGGWTLEAAEAICRGGVVESDQVLGLLAGLVDKSLVQTTASEGEARYGMLETIRGYAREKLREADEEAILRRSHLDWYVRLAEAGEAHYWDTQQMAWLERVEAELDNVRAALEWSREPGGDPEMGLRLVGALWRFWDMRPHHNEGYQWITDLLALTSKPTVARVNALLEAGYICLVRGGSALVSQRQCNEQALNLSRDLGYPLGVCISLCGFGANLLASGDPARAADYLEESLQVAEEHGEPIPAYGVLMWLGFAVSAQGDLDRGLAIAEQSVALAQQHGDLWAAGIASFQLALLCLLRGEHARATAILQEIMAMQGASHDRWGWALLVEGLAWVAASEGRGERTARLLGAADALWQDMGSSLWPFWRPEHERAEAAARAAIGAGPFATAWDEGRAMPPDAVLGYALEGSPLGGLPPTLAAPPELGGASTLTAREREIVALLARGLSNREIADTLVIAERTVHSHVGNVLGKLGLASRAQVAVWAVQHGFDPRP